MFQSVFKGTLIRNEPAYRPRPVEMAGYHKFSNGRYDAFVKLSALEAIAERTCRAAPNEMIGYVVGRPFRDAKGVYAVVTDAIFAESARCGPVTVETTLDDERELVSTILAEHPLGERLGWFHSHPFDMPVYSPTDLDNQRFWSESYQLGLLACLDRPERVSISAFRGPEAEPIEPAYTTSGSRHSHRVPAFRPGWETENRDSPLKPAQPTEPTTCRLPGLSLLTLAVGVVLPVIYLIGVWLIVEAIVVGRSGFTRPSPVAPAVAPPVKSVEQPTP